MILYKAFNVFNSKTKQKMVISLRKKLLLSSAVLLIILLLIIFIPQKAPQKEEVPQSESRYTARLAPPQGTNKYYFSDINIFYKHGYGMPNCTAYAYGRAYEILGTTPNLCSGNAGMWYSYNKKHSFYPYGSIPKVGAIACFDSIDGGAGHVAVVEAIDKTTVTFSQSAFSGEMFYTESVNITKPYGNFRFLGFIYILG